MRKKIPSDRYVRIKSAKYAGGYKLEIKFSDGHINIFDYSTLVNTEHSEFKPMRDIRRFKRFVVDKHGHHIHWGRQWNMLVLMKSLYEKKYIRPRWLFDNKRFNKR